MNDHDLQALRKAHKEPIMPDHDEFDALERGHRELSSAVSQLRTDLTKAITAVDGKVDMIIALIERSSARQDRSEERLMEVEREFIRFRERMAELRESDRNEAYNRITEAHERADQKIEAIKTRVLLGSGIFIAISVAGPMVITLWMSSS